MDLFQAQTLSSEIVAKLEPHCKQIIVVGSIRREKEFPRDIDIVLIPGNQGAIAVALRDLGGKIKAGPKIYQCWYKGQQVDIYIAGEETWPTLVLIRTGSKEHNIKLCMRAKALGGKLHADGSGLELPVGPIPEGLLAPPCKRVLPADEAHIFRLLALAYVEPSRRG